MATKQLKQLKQLKQACPACGGTGLYKGFCEGKDEAVICTQCEGQGWVWHQYTEFTGRKRRTGVKTIRASAGRTFLSGMGGVGQSMSYADFEKNFPVKEQ